MFNHMQCVSSKLTMNKPQMLRGAHRLHAYIAKPSQHGNANPLSAQQICILLRGLRPHLDPIEFTLIHMYQGPCLDAIEFTLIHMYRVY